MVKRATQQALAVRKIFTEWLIITYIASIKNVREVRTPVDTGCITILAIFKLVDKKSEMSSCIKGGLDVEITIL